MKKEVSPTQKILNVWAVVLILWSLYRAKFQTDLPVWFDEFIAKPLIFLAPIYYYVSKVEKLPFFESIELHKRKLSQELFIGVSLGLIFFITGGLAGFIRQDNLFSQLSSLIPYLPLIVLTAVATSFTEEALSRGFILKRLYQESNNIYTSSFLASILFFILHIPILFVSQINGVSLLYVMVTDVLFSITVSIVFLLRRSLVAPIIIHFFYLLSFYFYQGFS